MEFIKTYALLLTTLLLSLILLVILIMECFGKNKLIKWKLSLAFVNIFILILSFLFYESVILVNETLNLIFLGYVLLIFVVFAAMSFSVVNNCYQKSSDYTQFIESLNNTSWNVYYVCDKRDRIKEISESLLSDLGLEKKDVIGRKAFDVFDQTIRFTHVNNNVITNKELKEYYKTFAKTTKPKEEYKREIYFQNYNGQTVVLNLVEKPLYVGGKYRGRLNIGQKKTDASLAEVERELMSKNKDLESIQYKFIAALELTEEGIFFNDLDENYIWGNDVLVKDLKLGSNTIAYMNYKSLIYPDDLAIYTSTIRSLTPERPTYSISYRVKVGDKFEFVKETGKRIFDDEASNVILGFAKVVNTNYFQKTNMSEVDSAKGLDELLVTLDALYKDRRVFQLVCVNLTTLPEINNHCGRSVGNMIMNEYIKKLKNNFMSDSTDLYRTSGLVFYFIITDTRKMEFFKRGLLSDPKAMNLTLNYGSLHAELKVNIGVAEANIDGLNKEELIANCNAAINATLNPNFNLNYAFYKDLKDFGIR